MAEARNSKACRISVVTALGMWSGWHRDMPPAGPTGDPGLDAALADAFRMMIYLDTDARRFAWIERQLRVPEGPFGTCSPYQAELMRWWLDLFEAGQARPDHQPPARSATGATVRPIREFA